MGDNVEFEIILHHYWMDCKGWETHRFIGDLDGATRKAKELCFDRERQFNHCSFFVQPLGAVCNK